MNPESWVGHTSAIELWVAEILVSGILRDGKGGGRGRCARLETVIYGEGAVTFESQNLPQFWQETSS
jgi:hypothetical protein